MTDPWVMLYMVCHGSHQYTPFMLALIYQHHTMDPLGQETPYLMVKNYGFRLRFSLKPIQSLGTKKAACLKQSSPFRVRDPLKIDPQIQKT